MQIGNMLFVFSINLQHTVVDLMGLDKYNYCVSLCIVGVCPLPPAADSRNYKNKKNTVLRVAENRRTAAKNAEPT